MEFVHYTGHFRSQENLGKDGSSEEKFSTSAVQNIGHQPHVTFGHLKCGWFKLECALTVKYKISKI